MIHPTPTTLPGRCLTLIALGTTDLATLADRVLPAPRLTSTAHYHLWRAEYVAWQTDAPARSALVSRAVSRLREAGYVTPAKGPPAVAEDVPTPLTAEWLAARFRALDDVPEEGDVEVGGGTAPFDTALSIVARIRAGAATVEEAVGTSGCEWETWTRLCEAEVCVSPRRLAVTEKGGEMVEEWRKA